MSASFFKDNQSGGIVSLLMNDIAHAQNMVGNAMTNIWMDGIVIIVLMFIMLRIDVVLTLVSLSILPFYFFTVKRLGGSVRVTSKKVQDETEYLTGDLQEKISGFSVTQSFVRERFEQWRFLRESRRLFNYTLRSVKLNTWNNVIVGFLTSIAPVVVVWISGQRILGGALTIGEMIVFYSYLGQFYMPLTRFAELSVVFSTSMAAIERVFEAFDRQPDVQEMKDAIECPEDLKGEIEFRDVTFGYEKDKPVLKNINLKILPGQNIAIVGTSGCGKSTLINLIPRFYDPESGTIAIDGVDIKKYKLGSLRERIGMVFQESILFTGTIGENIAYGRPRATKKQVREAAIASNAYDFIEKLPDKFDTFVEEKGANLSGGQRQRIAITRVFVKDPSILMLDEATSSLDSESEKQIQQALERLMKGRTTIVIAHRLSTIVNADVILVMDNGEIVERGTHDELLESGGLYKHLFEEQFKDVVEMVNNAGDH
jgi:subfamily B ATP-binding cassette protein MsbA